MKKSNDDLDLTKQLNSFSISSNEEILAQKLNKTSLVPLNSMFSTSPHLQQFQQQPQQQPPQQTQPTASWNQRQNAVAWAKENADHWNTNGELPWNAESAGKDEGWGDGPPGYTTISQGTYFGFNSIMELPDKGNLSKTSVSTDASRQAFSKFKNKPVTFNSPTQQ